MAPSFRTLADGQRSQIWIGGPEQVEPELRYETTETLFEAPNWSLDGARLVLNGAGGLWLLDLDGDDPTPERVDFLGLPDINNDHVLAPDGHSIFMSAADGHIYRGSLTGGSVERVTHDEGWHFLHGVSPDGRRLAYVELGSFNEPGRLAVLEPDGAVTRIAAGTGHLDGPEWSPDGRWIHLNTENFAQAPGHAQLARIPDGGGPLERLLDSGTVDWFPHLSPDGTFATYISFPPGTLGHPANLDVTVQVVSTSDWSRPLQRYPLFGGQGTLNVNSWAPDSTRFAFVAYPVD